MIYMMGSKLFKAIVVLAVGGHACAGSCCAKPDVSACAAHEGSGQKSVHDLADGGMDMGDIPAPAEQEEPEVTPEMFEAAKATLEIEDADMETIIGYVNQVPAEMKDPSFSDEKLAQMFVYHYQHGEDYGEEDPEPKSKDNLIKELKNLVEVEIPQMMQNMQQSAPKADEADAEMADDVEAKTEEAAAAPAEEL